MKPLKALRTAMGLLVVTKTIFAWTAHTTKLDGTTTKKSSMQERLPLGDDLPTQPTTRRKILATAGGTTAAAVTAIGTTAVQPSWAAAPLDAGEAIRRGAANIPGYGATDVFFPESFGGSWKATREVEFPSGTRIQLNYPVRFLRSIEDDAVVADRGYNQAELEAALVQQTAAAGGEKIVQSYEWLVNNPNVLRVALSNGTKKEIKVTKRATERTDQTVTSSEFQRVTQEQDTSQPGGGIPTISARRVVSKWKQVDENRLEGLEIVYAMGGMTGDPLAAGSAAGAAQPTVLSKSRIVLTR